MRDAPREGRSPRRQYFAKRAVGVVAVGVVAVSVISVSVISVSVISVSVIAAGVVAVGIIAVGVIAVGIIAVGLVIAVSGRFVFFPRRFASQPEGVALSGPPAGRLAPLCRLAEGVGGPEDPRAFTRNTLIFCYFVFVILFLLFFFVVFFSHTERVSNGKNSTKGRRNA